MYFTIYVMICFTKLIIHPKTFRIYGIVVYTKNEESVL